MKLRTLTEFDRETIYMNVRRIILIRLERIAKDWAGDRMPDNIAVEYDNLIGLECDKDKLVTTAIAALTGGFDAEQAYSVMLGSDGNKEAVKFDNEQLYDKFKYLEEVTE